MLYVRTAKIEEPGDVFMTPNEPSAEERAEALLMNETVAVVFGGVCHVKQGFLEKLTEAIRAAETAAKRDAIIEFCEGDRSPLALKETAAYEKGLCDRDFGKCSTGHDERAIVCPTCLRKEGFKDALSKAAGVIRASIVKRDGWTECKKNPEELAAQIEKLAESALDG